MPKSLFPLLEPFVSSTSSSSNAYRSLRSHFVVIGIALVVYLAASQFLFKYVSLPDSSTGIFAGTHSVLVNRLGYLLSSPHTGQTLALKGPDGRWQIGLITKTGLIDQTEKYTVLDSQGRFRLIEAKDLVGRVIYPPFPQINIPEQTVLGQSDEEVPTPTSTPVLTRAPTPTPAPQIFVVSVRPKPSFTKPVIPFSSYLSEYLDPGSLGRVTFLGPFYDTTVGDPLTNEGNDIYNFDYYIVLTKGTLVPTTLHTSIVDITINNAPESLKPFLLNNRFCVTDTDCQLRQSHCQKGSYNRYERLIDAYACPKYNQAQDGTPFGVMDSTIGCVTDMQFGPTVCRGSACQTENQQLVCQP